jgi:phosphoadenosine phosphosulfate reductase
MNAADLEKINQELLVESPETILKRVIDLFGPRIALSSSLGAEDQVLTDMVVKINPQTRIFTLDTGRLFPETYDLIERTANRYKIALEVFFPDHARVQEMVNKNGINLFYQSVDNRKLCCNVRKIEPLQRAFSQLDAWICGLRSSQSVTRNNIGVVEWDAGNNLVKVNPLANWTEQQVWDYIKTHKVPYNVLHDKGFPSIGCQPCTGPVLPGQDVRAGRWWWENPETKECGLHKK